MNTILILHGWGSSSRNWAEVKKNLERQGLRVFVPDLPGFGDEPAPNEPWSVDDYVDWLKSYIEKQNLPPLFLAGHSFGGGLAVKFTNSYPQKVLKLILIASAIKRVRGLKYYFSLILAKMGKLIFSSPILCSLQPTAKRCFYWLIGSKDYYKFEILKMATMQETFKKIVKEDLLHYLPGIKISALIIWGNKDKITPLRDGYSIHNQIRGSRLEVISGVGHDLNLKTPEILAEKIIKFIG